MILSLVPRLKNSKEAQQLRDKLLQQQDGLDPIIGTKITVPVLDHQHFPPFKCRKVLQLEVNAFEGKVFNAYRRYIKHLSDASLIDVLKALIVYYSSDYSQSDLHYTAICDEIKPFKRVSSEIQEKILSDLNVEPGKNARKRVRQIRKLLLSGTITYAQLLEKIKIFDS